MSSTEPSIIKTVLEPLSTSTDPTRTVLGPLTTLFTYPTACSSNILWCAEPPCGNLLQGISCLPNADASSKADDPRCWPGRSSEFDIATPRNLQGWGIYSPASQCPVGYVAACSATGASGFRFQFSLTASETATGCCPSGYGCGSYDNAQTCTSLASSGSFYLDTCVGGHTVRPTIQTLPIIAAYTHSPDTMVIYEIDTMHLYAPLFQIVHQPSDLPASHSAATTDYNSQPVPTASMTPSPSSSPRAGLSTGAAAGTAVAVIAAVLLAAAGAWYCLVPVRRRRRLGDRYELEHVETATVEPPPVVYEMATGDKKMGVHEMPTTEKVNEMPAQESRLPEVHELS